jgi:phosphoribosylformylglycinamidine cyclo-ligase
MIHCTGGGQTKVKKFIKNKRVIKNNLLPIPPLFQLIQAESGTSWKEMYQVFNMGHRLEVYLDEKDAEFVVELSKSFGIEAQIIGRVEECDKEEVIIESEFGTFQY